MADDWLSNPHGRLSYGLDDDRLAPGPEEGGEGMFGAADDPLRLPQGMGDVDGHGHQMLNGSEEMYAHHDFGDLDRWVQDMNAHNEPIGRISVGRPVDDMMVGALDGALFVDQPLLLPPLAPVVQPRRGSSGRKSDNVEVGPRDGDVPVMLPQEYAAQARVNRKCRPRGGLMLDSVSAADSICYSKRYLMAMKNELEAIASTFYLGGHSGIDWNSIVRVSRWVTKTTGEAAKEHATKSELLNTLLNMIGAGRVTKKSGQGDVRDNKARLVEWWYMFMAYMTAARESNAEYAEVMIPRERMAHWFWAWGKSFFLPTRARAMEYLSDEVMSDALQYLWVAKCDRSDIPVMSNFDMAVNLGTLNVGLLSKGVDDPRQSCLRAVRQSFKGARHNALKASWSPVYAAVLVGSDPGDSKKVGHWVALYCDSPVSQRRLGLAPEGASSAVAAAAAAAAVDKDGNALVDDAPPPVVIEYYDSLGGADRSANLMYNPAVHAFVSFCKWLRGVGNVGGPVKLLRYVVGSSGASAHQTDGSSCGAFVFKFLEERLAGVPFSEYAKSKVDLSGIRERVVNDNDARAGSPQSDRTRSPPRDSDDVPVVVEVAAPRRSPSKKKRVLDAGNVAKVQSQDGEVLVTLSAVEAPRKSKKKNKSKKRDKR